MTANNGLPIFNSALRPNVDPGANMTLDHPDPLLYGAQLPATKNHARDTAVIEEFLALSERQFIGVSQHQDLWHITAARSYTQLRAPNSYNESFGLMRHIKLGEKATLMLRGEFFNTYNRVVFGAPVSNVSASNFGRVTSQANAPRQGQVAARIDF